MSDQLKLVAEPRTEFGKGFARRARAEGKIPAVIYGHGTDPVHVTLPAHSTGLALKHSNALFTIQIGDVTEMVIAKDVQRDPVRRIIEHIDLLLVKKGEKITVEVAIHITGESYPGTIHVQEHSSLQILALATNLPESIEVSVEGLVDGDKITAGEVALPEGSELVTDADALVVAISVPRSGTAADDEADEAAAEAATGSPSVPDAE